MLEPRHLAAPLAAADAGGVLLRVLIGLAVVIAVVAIAIAAGAGSLPKAEIRSRTLALEKNAPFAEASREVQLPGGDVALVAHFPRDVEPEGAAGEATPAPIVLVHGTPDTMGAWGPLLFGEGALAGRFDVWTIEVTGHGMAAPAEGPFPFQRCADFVARTLEALGLEGVTLVGNSYGGEFCWRAALDRPELVGRLVLIDSSGLHRTQEQFLSEEVKMRDWGFAARLGYLLNSEPRVASALDPHFEGGADDGRVHEVWLGLENRGNWNAMIDLVRDENGGREDELGDLAAPTLLVFGEHDEAYPPEVFGREFERRIPDARLEVVEGAGHYPHEQRPAEVARLLSAFASGE